MMQKKDTENQLTARFVQGAKTAKKTGSLGCKGCLSVKMKVFIFPETHPLQFRCLASGRSASPIDPMKTDSRDQRTDHR